MSFRNNNNVQGELWYEETGPDAKYVREHIFTKFKVNEITNKELTNKELNDILLKNIPNSKTDFGSWKGYAIFGLDEKLYNNIKKDIKILIKKKQIKKAYKVLNDKFVPIVTHKLYEPNGFMTKKISKRTNVGKAKRKLDFQ